jgi:cytochrome P450
LCRDPEWLRITINYTVDAITGALALRLWPSFIRPVVHWFLPYCQKVRKYLAEGRAIIDPVLKKRREEKRTAAAMGNVAEKHLDAMEWLEEVAKGRKYDPVTAQVMLSLAAIHTLSDALTQVLHDLCQHPEVIQSLRDEIYSVVHEHGWQKSTLYNLKLMDSVLKESQRLKPAALGKPLLHSHISTQ